MSVPIASKVTVPEPDTAANAAHERMVAIARPPGIGAGRDFIKSMSLEAIPPRDKEWKKMSSLFENFPSARQYLSFTIELAQTSCGFGVPFYDYKQSRDNMDKWLEAKGAGNMEEYWHEKKQISLDGLPTNIT